MFITPKGERVIDFGQNIAGYVSIDLTANKGDKIVISHAELATATAISTKKITGRQNQGLNISAAAVVRFINRILHTSAFGI